jgi:hypothetical protein
LGTVWGWFGGEKGPKGVGKGWKEVLGRVGAKKRTLKKKRRFEGRFFIAFNFE